MFFASTAMTALLFALCGLLSGVNGLTITTAEQLITFSSNVNTGTSYYGSTVYLDSDIDLTSTLSPFQPIGKTETNYFNGTFDGQGHTISGIIFNASLKYVGLFGYSAETTIKNFVMDSSCSFLFPGLDGNAGSIAGACSSCLIDSVVNMGSITFNERSSAPFYFGGIVGRLSGSSTVRNCVNYGTITQSKNIGDVCIGGVVGVFVESNLTGYIQNCANYGPLSHTSGLAYQKYLYMGGILGKADNGTVIIENCLSARMIRNSTAGRINYVGSVVGHD